jgi:hypothetical protein
VASFGLPHYFVGQFNSGQQGTQKACKLAQSNCSNPGPTRAGSQNCSVRLCLDAATRLNSVFTPYSVRYVKLLIAEALETSQIKIWSASLQIRSITVSLASSGRAVVRCRTRRHPEEWMRDYSPRLPASDEYKRRSVPADGAVCLMLYFIPIHICLRRRLVCVQSGPSASYSSGSERQRQLPHNSLSISDQPEDVSSSRVVTRKRPSHWQTRHCSWSGGQRVKMTGNGFRTRRVADLTEERRPLSGNQTNGHLSLLRRCSSSWKHYALRSDSLS